MAKDSSKNKSLAKAKKRARTAKGRFKADNPKTPNVNEAYENKSILTKNWKTLLNKVKLYSNKKHNFKNKLMKNKKVNCIKVNIYPDGGISRIRAFGKVE